MSDNQDIDNTEQSPQSDRSKKLWMGAAIVLALTTSFLGYLLLERTGNINQLEDDIAQVNQISQDSKEQSQALQRVVDEERLKRTRAEGALTELRSEEEGGDALGTYNVVLEATAAFENELDSPVDYNIANSAKIADYLVIDFKITNDNGESLFLTESDFKFSSGDVDYSKFVEWFVDFDLLENGEGDERQPGGVEVKPGETLEGDLLVWTKQGAPDQAALPDSASQGTLSLVGPVFKDDASVNLSF